MIKDYSQTRDEMIGVISPQKLILEDKSLSLFQKILLMTDGTVTDLLRIYTNDKIVVKKLNHDFTLSGKSEEFLCPLETSILKREILLGDKMKNYIYADSTLIFENLSRTIQSNLLETDCPIGLLWKNEKLETYREITDIRSEYNGELSKYFDVHPNTPLLSRTYLIHNNHKKLGMITEKFPITYFRGDIYDQKQK
ncbi:chorismate pyruvate-lyase family protein [Bacillus cereus]|uniref:chorismate pyruvate-lyase family protein n=1 Tax=Bacillus cereus TaxID=1396 RepID=UPI000BF57E32|nr:chorismate pyruvate-lyase family protein [Bacillus cereus]PEW07823.1 4-hydroxybenzoate synthetase [Bacillus cereus]